MRQFILISTLHLFADETNITNRRLLTQVRTQE